MTSQSGQDASMWESPQIPAESPTTSHLVHGCQAPVGGRELPKMPLLRTFRISFFFNLFIYFWLCWVFVSVRGLSPVVASGGHSSSRCAGLSLSRPLPLRSTGSRCAGSVLVAHGLSCSVACGIFPDQGSNLCSLHWQADS